MEFIVSDQMVLLRAPDGRLAPYITSFSEWVIGQGYSQCSLRQRVRIAAGFSCWLAGGAVPLNGVSCQHSAQYLRYRAQRQRVCEGDATEQGADLIPVEMADEGLIGLLHRSSADVAGLFEAGWHSVLQESEERVDGCEPGVAGAGRTSPFNYRPPILSTGFMASSLFHVG